MQDHTHEHADHHSHSHDHEHASAHVHASAAAAAGHTHEHLEHAGHFHERDAVIVRDLTERAMVVGCGGPVGSGKTALMLELCKALRDKYSIAAVTNDIFTREDAEFLTRNNALPADRIMAIETGGCPHAAIREDISANLQACEIMTAKHKCEMVFVESGGDNLAANFSRELADYIIYVIDVAGGDKIPRKGGPGITQSDLLVINKTDLAQAVGADVTVMDRDAKIMRGDGPTVFTQVKNGVGVLDIIQHILTAYEAMLVQQKATAAGAARGDNGHAAKKHKA